MKKGKSSWHIDPVIRITNHPKIKRDKPPRNRDERREETRDGNCHVQKESRTSLRNKFSESSISTRRDNPRQITQTPTEDRVVNFGVTNLYPEPQSGGS